MTPITIRVPQMFFAVHITTECTMTIVRFYSATQYKNQSKQMHY